MYVLVEHQKTYLNRRISEIQELKQALNIDDFEVAIRIGHKLKGNGETFGYPEISAIGNILELAAVTKDKNKINEAIEKLAQIVEESLDSLFRH
jgi:HPt (histidine-containing phosphotransfer) domain-containing protein